jgi:hypothetical protein
MCIYIYKIYKVICLEKINGFYFKNTSTMLILSAMNYTKMNMVEKPNVAIIIITMLEILSKKKWLRSKVSVILILIETTDSLIRLYKCDNTTITPHLHRC